MTGPRFTIDRLDPATPRDWMTDAICTQTDPDRFFPDAGGGDRGLAAKRICGTCPVAAQCLQYALDNDITYGIFGGLSPNQRTRTVNSEKSRNGHPKPVHGTRTMYQKGCKNEATCPRGEDGRSCSQAQREYSAAWELRHRRAGAA